ncbi:hypothetical protein HIMB11_01653 [Rhodobacteraceae bacterium HIMB11]|nr:hypothetical protein HIMB11_01653 [Rhodobacteraceae bacterium HIMB11]
MSDPVCPLCERSIPPDAPQSLHHLIPKLKGGKGGPTILIHHICHKEIHATLSEAELARSYASVDALRAHPRLAKFFLNGSQNVRRSFCQRPLAGVENDKIRICLTSVKRRYHVGAKVNEMLISTGIKPPQSSP